MIRRLSLVLIAVAALAAPSSAVAAPKTLDVSPQQLAFGEQPFHTLHDQVVHRQEREKKPLAVSIDTGFVPDDFSPGPARVDVHAVRVDHARQGTELHLRGRVLRRPGRPFLGDRRIDLRVVARVKGKIVATKTVVVTATPVAPAEVLDVDPSSVSFGDQPFETLETRSFTVTNVWSHTIGLTSDAGLPDDFSHLIFSTCGLGDRTLAPGRAAPTSSASAPRPTSRGSRRPRSC